MMNAFTRESATELFLQFVIERARNGVVEDIHGRLAERPAGRRPSPLSVARHEWFRDLSSEDQSRIMAIVRESVDSAIFGVLVVLDGLSGGNPIEGVTSDFSLELQTYTNEEARAGNAAETSVRINPSNTTELLHDLFRWKLEDRSND